MQFPGTYNLPCGEGDYSVTDDNRLTFRPRGSNGYTHANITVVNMECIKTINLGYLSFNVWVGFSNGTLRPFKQIMLPKIKTKINVQRQFIYKFLLSLGTNVKTITDLTQQYKCDIQDQIAVCMEGMKYKQFEAKYQDFISY